MRFNSQADIRDYATEQLAAYDQSGDEHFDERVELYVSAIRDRIKYGEDVDEDRLNSAWDVVKPFVDAAGGKR